MRKFLFIPLVIFLCSGDYSKLVRRKLADGISISLPKELKEMSDDEIADRYPSSKKPLAMFSSEDRNVDFGFNVTKSPWGNNFALLKDFYKATILSSFQSATIIKEDVVTRKKQKYVWMEFTSKIDKHRNYTIVQYTVVKGRIFLFHFTCPEYMKEKLQPVAQKMMESVKVVPGKVDVPKMDRKEQEDLRKELDPSKKKEENVPVNPKYKEGTQTPSEKGKELK